MLDIISITRNDVEGVLRTIESTELLRGPDSPMPASQLIIDSSDEGSASIVSAACAGRRNLRYQWTSPQGIAAAMNVGTASAMATWIWYLNGGDILLPDADIELLARLLKSSLADSIIFEQENAVDVTAEQGRLLFRRPALPWLWPPLNNWIPHQATIIKREAVVAMGGYRNLKVMMDLDLWIRLFSAGYTTDLISIPLTRFAPGGMSSGKRDSCVDMMNICFCNAPALLTHSFRTLFRLPYRFLRSAYGAAKHSLIRNRQC